MASPKVAYDCSFNLQPITIAAQGCRCGFNRCSDCDHCRGWNGSQFEWPPFESTHGATRCVVLHEWRQHGKAGCIIQPAVQRQQWWSASAAPGHTRDGQIIYLPLQLPWLRGHYIPTPYSGGKHQNCRLAWPGPAIASSTVARPPGDNTATLPGSPVQ